MKTFYDLLGVDRNASLADIEQKYRQSLNAHIVGNNTRPWSKKDQLRLQQMRQAYLKLSSPSERLEYDLNLNLLEHARLRMMERVGTVVGLALLVLGLGLIGRSYYLQVYSTPLAVQAVKPVASAAGADRGDTVLASKDVSEARTDKATSE